MQLSVIIINYGTQDMTEQVIKAFSLRENRLNYEIILIDNKSKEKLDEKKFEKFHCIIIKNKRNFGFAKAVNQGIKKAQGEYILLLNSDVFVSTGSLSTMVEYLEENPEIAVAGPKMLFPDRKYQISAGFFPCFSCEVMRLTGMYKLIPYSTFLGRNYIESRKRAIQEVDWLSGGCMLIRKDIIVKIGDFDASYFLGVEDIDFCYRVKQAGGKVVYMPNVQVVHKHGGSSNGTRSFKRLFYDRQGFNYFYLKHYSGKIIRRKLLWLLATVKIFYFRIVNYLAGKK